MFRIPVALSLMLLFAGLPLCANDDALATAEKAFEKQRNALHRESFRVEWPDAAQLPAVPAHAEMLEVSGYINYTITWYRRVGDKVLAQRANARRSWAYSPKEEYIFQEREIDPAGFAAAWKAVSLIDGVKVVDLRPPPSPAPAGTFTRSYGMSMSSHESTDIYGRRDGSHSAWSTGGTRGTSLADGVPELSFLQPKAQFACVSALWPGDEKSDQTFALKEWEAFLIQLLDEQVRARQADLREPEQTEAVLTEVALRLLGELGTPAAEQAILRMQEAAGKSGNLRGYRKERLSEEIAIALEKCETTMRFDEKKVRAAILARTRQTNADRDLSLWLRARYWEKEPDAYRTFLKDTAADPAAGEALLLETITDLSARYPGQETVALTSLLANPSSEVAVEAALALLARDPASDDALRALARIASDPGASIPERAGWFSRFGRDRALDYLYSSKTIPPASRWDAARVRHQLRHPGEDGRMVKCLLTALWIIENTPVSKEEQLAAYQLSLKTNPEGPGADCAREQIAELGGK